MQDFNRPYEKNYDQLDHYPRPDKEDLKTNWKVKLTLLVMAVAIIVTIVMDTLGFIGKWG